MVYPLSSFCCYTPCIRQQCHNLRISESIGLDYLKSKSDSTPQANERRKAGRHRGGRWPLSGGLHIGSSLCHPAGLPHVSGYSFNRMLGLFGVDMDVDFLYNLHLRDAIHLDEGLMIRFPRRKRSSWSLLTAFPQSHAQGCCRTQGFDARKSFPSGTRHVCGMAGLSNGQWNHSRSYVNTVRLIVLTYKLGIWD